MKIACTSPSFSKNKFLIEQMQACFIDFKLNEEGKIFNSTELVTFLTGYDAAIIGLDEINENILKQLPQLKIISKYGVGLNNIDLEACEKFNITIGWTGGVNKLSVAEMVIGNIISLNRNLYVTSNLLSNGIWLKDGGNQLSNKTIGVIGVGHIGKEVIRLLKPFNCKILVNDIIEQKKYYSENNLIEATKSEIFELADIITLHTPLTADTKYLLSSASFNKMKRNAVIINTARGELIKENDLIYALKNKTIAGAAIDVYETEPPTNKDLLQLPNLICTPHIGGNSKEAVEAMGISAINHIKKFIKELD